MLRSTFSTTTMASSTTMPIASTRPKSERLFSENPNSAIRKNVPISETGIATIGNDGCAPRLQEEHDDKHDKNDRFQNGFGRPR